MNIKSSFFAERSLTKIAAIFDTRSAAEMTVRQLQQQAGMSESQVKLLGPNDLKGVVDPPYSRKLEPEQSGIWHTLIRAHVAAGLIGILGGGMLFVFYTFAGNDAISSSPYQSLGVMLFFGGIAGLMTGGLLSLRPDHYRVMAAVKKAIKRGNWAVVSHPVNAEQTRLIMAELRLRSKHIVRSF